MPFLRVVRDKRGYSTTYLLHAYRDGHRQRSRILYVFRTPGGVRVGREALEPERLRQIASEHPEIVFDWRTIVDTQQIVDSSPEVRRPRKRPAEDEAAAVAPSPPVRVEARRSESATLARASMPATIEGATPDEQIAFLTTWYPQIRERVTQRTPDPVRQEALLALAERLNPAMWIDADQITTGLQQASEALERLATVFAARRRRARRKSKPGPAAAGAPAAPPARPAPDA